VKFPKFFIQHLSHDISSIKMDGRELEGVVRYEIREGVGESSEITITFTCGPRGNISIQDERSQDV
jgi:hypothetical protein